MQLTKLAMFKFFSKQRHFIIKLSVLMLAVFLLTTSGANAGRWINTDQEALNVLSPGFGVPNGERPIDPRKYIANIIQVILGFLGVIALILIIYGGFSWMTAQGNKDKVEKAQQILTASIIGLLIVLAAFSVTIFVTNAIVGSTNTNAKQIKQSVK